MKIQWPPAALGLGPQLNLVMLLPDRRTRLGGHALQQVGLAIALAMVIAAIDQVFFGGMTAQRTPALDLHPTPPARVIVTFAGGLVEELLFRVLVATGVASLLWMGIRRASGESRFGVATAQWTGVIAAAVFVAVWHVGMSNDAGGAARVVAVNLIANLLYGWTWWRRGLEMAVLTHGTLNASLYLGLPLLH